MRISTPNIRPAGIDHVLMRYSNLIRLRRQWAVTWAVCQGVSLERHHGPLTTNMRVIAGKFRSRPLRSIRGLDIRPTADRLRETLFNVLIAGNPQALQGSVWVDLFAGTGAVGIEALSRGAREVHFVESSKSAVEAIRKNLQSLAITEGIEIWQEELPRALWRMERQKVTVDVVFLDPPYRMKKAYSETLQALAKSSLIGAMSVVIAEHEKKFDPGEEIGTLRRFRLLVQGDAALSFYRLSGSGEPHT